MVLQEKYINPFTDFGFKKLFGTEPNEKEQYEESLKSYRDLKNVIDTSYSDGKKDEKKEGIIQSLKRGKLTIEEIAEDFRTTVDFILQIKKEQNM